MIKVGELKKGDWFIHKNCTYKVLDVDYVFVKSEKAYINDDTTYYILKDIEVSTDIASNYQWVNPDYGISDLRKQNND